MSFQATNWASRQSTGSVSAKAVLMALANYAGERGECYPSQEKLAAQTEQSVDTVQRRLRDLVKAGLIFRPTQYRRGSGHYGVGITIVLCSADAVDYARSLGYEIDPNPMPDDAQNEPTNEEISTGHRTANCGAAEPQIAVRPNRTDAVRNNQTDITLTPKSPFPKPEPPPADDGFDEFEKSWPWTEGEAREPARRNFGKLAAADRLLAIRGIGNFLAFRQRKQRRIGPARTYLRDRCWEGFNGAKSSASPEQVWIEVGSLEWQAWETYHRIKTGLPLHRFTRTLPDGRRSTGKYVNSIYPPGESSRVAEDVEL